MPEQKLDKESLAFISDWQKRARSQQKKHRILLICTLVIAFVICSSLFFWYRNTNYNRIVNLNTRYVQDSALQEANKVQRELNDTITLIQKYSRQYTTLSTKYPNLNTEQKLNLLWDGTLFDRIGLITPEGIDVSVSGSCDVSDRHYFQDGMNGGYGYELLESSRLTGKTVLVFYTPVYVDDEITGVMAGFYDRHRMDEMLEYTFLNFEPHTYLVQKDGSIVGSSQNNIVNDNLLNWLSNKKFTGENDYNEIIDAIHDEDRTNVTFSFVDGHNTSVGVVAQFDNSEWMIITILPHNVTSDMVDKANAVGNIVMLILALAFVAMIVVFITFLFRQDKRLNSEMHIATDSLQKTARHDHKQTTIAESLGNTYSSVYFVDSVKEEYERMVERDNNILTIPDKGTWEAGWQGYVNNFVDPMYFDIMLKYSDINMVKQELETSENICFEYQRADKSWRKAFLIPSERNKNGELKSFIFAVQKIEAEKKRELETQLALKEAYEAAQLASKAKTTFLSNMSHDIRTPMNAIVGMTAIAAANLNNSEKVSDCLKKISSSSKHLLGLINEVLDMSKIESGKIDLNEEKFCLSDILDELITMNQPLIKEKGHTLMVKVIDLTHENVIGDSTRLQQVFTNLLTNAIKYTPSGGKLEIIVSEKNTNKSTIGWYEVKFKDNGIGMSEEFQKNIFDPFSRADDSRLSTIQGTGLGMPIARNIIRMMNGDITVESKLNEGSTFTVSFALKLQNEDKKNYENFVDLPVLVVDDDESACESTCLMLNSLSMNSEWVTSGREAVEKTVEHHQRDDDYYALIIDWKMPGMNGIETTKAIREKIGDKIPIIVISAYDWTDIEQEARSAGANAFLSKPLFKSRVVDLFAELSGSKKKDEAPTSGDISENDFTGKRILLAEDNELNREIAVEILSMMGLEIETAENGKICLDMLTDSEPGYYDLVFMDIQMPVMNGYDSAAAIRSAGHPDSKKIPIIAMTANAFSTDVRAAFESGMNGHISKPIDIGNVVSVLKENLK